MAQTFPPGATSARTSRYWRSSMSWYSSMDKRYRARAAAAALRLCSSRSSDRRPDQVVEVERPRAASSSSYTFHARSTRGGRARRRPAPRASARRGQRRFSAAMSASSLAARRSGTPSAAASSAVRSRSPAIAGGAAPAPCACSRSRERARARERSSAGTRPPGLAEQRAEPLPQLVGGAAGEGDRQALLRLGAPRSRDRGARSGA